MRRTLLLAALLSAAFGWAVQTPSAEAPPARASIVGIADQRASTFDDPRLTELPVRHARLSVAWDALRYRWQRREIDHWMRAAGFAGMKTLVTFGRSRARAFRLPRPTEYARQVRAFRRRYPQVREYSPWNEPNLAVRPENYDPRRIAAYYRTLRSTCPRCRVLGADLVDQSSLERWMRSYLRLFPRGRRPRLWGLHNYVDANSASAWGTRTMLRLAPGQVWFTETGAIVRRRRPSSSSPVDRRKLIRTGRRRAAAATRRVFRLARMSRKVTRVYLYHWKADRRAVWDSGLISPKDTVRPSFPVFARHARLGAGEELGDGAGEG